MAAELQALSNESPPARRERLAIWALTGSGEWPSAQLLPWQQKLMGRICRAMNAYHQQELHRPRVRVSEGAEFLIKGGG